MITWQQIRLQCIEHFREEASYKDDNTAKREFWLVITDDLCRAGLITQAQRDSWSCPF